DFEHVVRGSGVSTGVSGDFGQCIVVDGYFHVAKSAFFVGECPTEQGNDVVLRKRLENVNARPREQRGDDFEGRILSGCVDQADVAFFYVGKEGVLLGFVETMNLIDENNRAGAEVAGFRSICHHLLDLLDPAENGRELNEVGFGDAGDNLGQRCLSHSGRTPENDGSRIVALALQTQWFSWHQQVLLSNDFIKRSRTHALRQRSRSGSCSFPIWKGGEETHRAALR